MTAIIIGILLVISIIIVLFLYMMLRRIKSLDNSFLSETLSKEFRNEREESSRNSSSLRQEILNSQKSSNDTIISTIGILRGNQKDQLESVSKQVQSLSNSNEQRLNNLRQTVDLNLNNILNSNDKKMDQMAQSQKATVNSLLTTIGELGRNQKDQMELVVKRTKDLTGSNETLIKQLLGSISTKLGEMQNSNEKKLEQMRETVDEKLQSTLEKRLGESFKVVSQRLEAVQQGLGEMRTLATGVGDLKRVLTNVKTRGTWGEVRLAELLGQILTPEQYEANVNVTKGSNERVEFAIKLPGAENCAGSEIWLPIDSKFPVEDYQKLTDATEKADKEEVLKYQTALKRSVENSAKDINRKYINPPETTDFAIMFLPTEGLFSEVIRQPGLLEKIQMN